MIYFIYILNLKKEKNMIKILYIVLMTSCSLNMFARKSKTSKIVQEADQMYLHQQYSDALSGYSMALKKYPKRKKLRLKFAKTLYRLERYSEAYKIFKGLDPKDMNSEDNFESGMSAFNEKNYKMASVNFSYVQPNFQLFDIACYYGGVASYNIGKHDIARQYFKKATVLPSELMKNKKTYIYFMDNPPKENEDTKPQIYNDSPNKYDFIHQK